MLRIILSILMAGILGLSGQSQDSFSEQELRLAFNADVMINAHKASHRSMANSLFKDQFIEVLQKENSFSFPFDSLIWISKIKPSDQSFRIFSWQIKADNDTVQYFGVLQKENGAIFELKERKGPVDDMLYELFSDFDWLGQMYYDIHENGSGDSKSYLLFGYRETASHSKQKIAESLILSEEGLQFGDELFFKEDARHGENRIFIEYAKIANASLKFDPELEMIIFDHLVPVINPYEDNKMMMVPEGTLEAYFLEKGKWIYKEKIFNQAYDLPPMPNPVLKDRDKNIFGK
jgi:hypothetical protein